MPLPAALLLDLDGTLLDTPVGQRAAVEATGREAQRLLGIDPGRWIEADVSAAAEVWPATGDDWVLGRVPTPAVSMEIYRRALVGLGEDPALAEHFASMHAIATRNGARAFDDVGPLLEVAAERRIRTAVVTNGAGDAQRDAIDGAGLTSRVDAIIASGEHGVAKPDPRIFAIALAELGVGADQAWHVGDSAASDVAGAQASGIRAIWLDRSGQGRADSDPVPDLTVRSLAELVPMLAAG